MNRMNKFYNKGLLFHLEKMIKNFDLSIIDKTVIETSMCMISINASAMLPGRNYDGQLATHLIENDVGYDLFNLFFEEVHIGTIIFAKGTDGPKSVNIAFNYGELGPQIKTIEGNNA